MVCIPVLDGGKEARDETLRTTAWEARFAQTVNCFYGPYPFVYIGQPTSKRSNPLLLLSGILTICLTINYFLSWPKDDKI